MDWEQEAVFNLKKIGEYWTMGLFGLVRKNLMANTCKIESRGYHVVQDFHTEGMEYLSSKEPTPFELKSVVEEIYRMPMYEFSTKVKPEIPDPVDTYYTGDHHRMKKHYYCIMNAYYNNVDWIPLMISKYLENKLILTREASSISNTETTAITTYGAWWWKEDALGNVISNTELGVIVVFM